jgi:DNA modification methylase
LVKGFNPPTRTDCSVCEAAPDNLVPHIDSHRGKASASDNFPIHNWFNFTLGYTPEFPEFLLKRSNLPLGSLVGDPFLGAGTTSVVAKSLGYKSIGIEANDYFEFAATTKLNWKVDSVEAENILELVEKRLLKSFSKFLWPTEVDGPYIGELDFKQYAQKKRPDELVERYISDAPLAKLELIKDELEKVEWPSKEMRDFFFLALTSCVLPVSNVKYGPGFGVVKPKVDAPVLTVFLRKANRMILDLREPHVVKNKNVSSIVKLGDARKMSSYMGHESVDMLVTSPPYPGDHEYTKHSRLELMFMDIARTKEQFRVIKKRMLRGSTTNIYKEDSEGEKVKSLKSIHKVVNEIDVRLKADGATSGFEKLYTKLIWEYFGGMYLVFEEALKVLKPGGSFSLLVSDSHAFKMVHISTADLLAEVAKLAGFKKPEVELWQFKKSTSHKFKMYENILTVYKPK